MSQNEEEESKIKLDLPDPEDPGPGESSEPPDLQIESLEGPTEAPEGDQTGEDGNPIHEI